jgi:hypothetical protein
MGAYRFGRQVERRTVGLAVFVAMSCLVWGLPAAAQASSSPPVIGNEFVSHITEHDATLEAYIDPNGLKTTYQFRLESGCLPPSACLVITTYPLPSSEIPASAGAPDQVVLDLNSAGVTLNPDTEYRYSIEATSSAGTTDHPGQVFTTAPASTPSVESASVSNITPTDATIQAQINPEGLETTYEVSVATVACIMMRPQGPGPDSCEATPHGQIVGTIPAGFSTQTVGVDIAKAWQKLKPSTWYVFYVSVANMDGNSGGIPDTSNQFETAAASPPLIESESVSHLTSTDATLEGQINTEGLETTYNFYLQEAPLCFKANPPCERPQREPLVLPAGKLLGSFVGQSVSVELNSAGVSLSPGEHYEYWVTATNAAGTTTGLAQEFTAPEEKAQPLDTTTPSRTNGNNQATSSTPTGSGGSPAPGVTPLGPQIVCLCNCARGCHGKKVSSKPLTRTQKLSKVLKACAKKPKRKRAACQKQAREKYATTASKAKKR